MVFMIAIRFDNQFITLLSGIDYIQLLNKEWKSISNKKYDKSQTGIYKLLHAKINTAMSNAKGVLKEAKSTNEMNPSTEVFELVDKLINIRK